MDLAELEASLDNLFQALLLEVGRDGALNLVKSLSERHYGIDALSTPASAAVHDADLGGGTASWDPRDVFSEMSSAEFLTFIDTEYQDPDPTAETGTAMEGVVVTSPDPSDHTDELDVLSGNLHAERHSHDCNLPISRDSSGPDPALCDRDGKRLRWQALRMRPVTLYREHLVELLGRHWDTLTSSGLFNAGADERLQLPTGDQPVYIQRRGYHTILRGLEKTHELNPWRRAIAEHRTLGCYTEFEEELRYRRGRKRGESTKNMAHREYVAHMFPDAALEERDQHRTKLKSDLQFARRWAILIQGCVEGGVATSGAGVGLFLAASPRVIRSMYTSPPHDDLAMLTCKLATASPPRITQH
jgi:hypothetical protein